MVKFFGLFIFLLTFVLFEMPAEASAVTGQSGTIGANLTITPDDPIALESVTFNIEFRDTAKYFTLKRCNCSLSIKDDSGSIIYSAPLLQDGTYVNERIPPITFTFPAVGAYLIEIAGTSTNQVFKPFVIKFEQKIESKHVAPWIKKLKAWINTLFSDVLPVIVALVVLPLGWKFLVVQKSRKR
ncbi:MAG: hypothetical protein Q7S34_02615 [bacterium]|nr:hypothetical protein [bacterium]